MRSYSIELTAAAARQYRRLQPSMARRIARALDDLALDPRPRGATKLAGHDDYRIRVGDHRVVYSVLDHDLRVVIARIAHRRDAYRR